MKIVAVVPIKLNSSRLPQKNIKCFTNGEPLCNYILKTLKSIKEIEEVYVYCSNSDIIDYLPQGVKYLQRSTKLDCDTTKINDVLYEFVKEIKADVYVMAHTTAPFIKNKSIEKGLSAIMEKKFDSAFSVNKMQDFLWKDGKPFNYDLGDIPRTQDLEPIYKETSGFYIFRRDIMKNFRKRIGERPYIVEVSEIEGIDIDEEEDFIIADAIFNYRANLN